MRLAILETGRAPGDLPQRFGDYPSMVRDMLGDGFDTEAFDVAAGHFPDHPADHPAYIITGSPAGVYDPLPWIDRLRGFIRAAEASKMVGLCFGHQIMADAMGGQVQKSEKGWGTGLHRYAIDRVEPWMDSATGIAVPASHQDQVTVQPPGTRLVASSEFTPFAAFAWADRTAISFQFHPEFSVPYAKALIAERYDQVPDADAAIASLDAPNDSARVAGWIRQFLQA